MKNQKNPTDWLQTDLAPSAQGISILNFSADTRHALVTTAIGGTYFEDFCSFSLPYWKLYAEKHGLAIVVIHDLVAFENRDSGLNGAWLKLLAPAVVAKAFPLIQRIAIVDTDVIINPGAPDIFADSPSGEFGVVSLVKNLPFDLLVAKKRLAFLRRSFYSDEYPLDSSLFATPQQEYEMEGLPVHDNLFCSGLIVLPQTKAPFFSSWFEEASQRDARTAVAWEQNFLNHKVISHGCHWLPYQYQAIWNLEMANYHPSAYLTNDLSRDAAAQGSVADSLNNNFFLHFAGSWHESRAWMNPPEDILRRLVNLEGVEFSEYLRTTPTGHHVGKLLPGASES
jgi:hypothetical protein